MGHGKANILIIGAGTGGISIIRILDGSDEANVLGVVDRDPDAPGLRLAEELGIATSPDYREFVESRKEEIDEIINVTGSKAVQKELMDIRPENVEVIGGHSAELMWGLMEEKTRIESALKESEERYKLLVEGASQPIFRVNSKGTFLFMNSFAAVQLGGRPEDFLGKSIWALFPKDIADGQMETIKKAIDSGKKVLAERRSVVKEGERFYQASIQPMTGEPGKSDSAIVILTDITDQKKVEEEFEAIFTKAANGIVMVDINGCFVRVNRSFCDMLGYSAEEILGKSPLDLTHPDDKSRSEKMLQQVACGERMTFDQEKRLIKKDGTPLWVKVSVSSVCDRQDNLNAYVGVVADITERKKMEEAIKESRDYLNKIINSIADPIFVKDEQHKWVMLNEAYCEFMGYPRHKLIGKSDHDYFPEDEADIFWEKDSLVFETGKENRNEEKFTDAKGITHTIVTKKTLYLDANGRKVLVGIIRDISERKKVEDELHTQRELLTNILDHIPYFVFWKDIDSVYLGCNENFVSVAGLDKQEDIVGKTDYDLAWKKEESDYYRSCDREVMDKKKPMLNIEEPQLQSDGKEAVLLTSKVPLLDRDDNVFGILGIYADITERKQIEDRIKESEARYRTIFENTGTATIIINDDMVIQMANSEFCKLVGLPQEELEDKRKFHDFVGDIDTEKAIEYHRLRRIDPEAVPRNYEVRIVDSLGDGRDIFVTVALIPGTESSVASLLDITDIKKNELELKRQKELLDNTNKALEHKLRELQEAVGHIKKLEGLVPICAHCKKMLNEGRDPRKEESWIPLEKYISERTDASFTHGLCPDCVKLIYKGFRRPKK